MDLINQIVNSGVFKPPAPPRDSSWFATAQADSVNNTVSVLLDGDSTAVTIPTCVPVVDGDRLVTLLLGRTRLVVGNLGGLDLGADLTAASLSDFVEGLTALASGSVATGDLLAIDDASAGAAKSLSMSDLATYLNGVLGFVASASVLGTWNPSWSCSGSMTIASVTGSDFASLVLGKLGICWWKAGGFTTGGTADYDVRVALPSGWSLDGDVVSGGLVGVAYAYTGSYQVCPVMLQDSDTKLGVSVPGKWGIGSSRVLYGAMALLPLA